MALTRRVSRIRDSLGFGGLWFCGFRFFGLGLFGLALKDVDDGLKQREGITVERAELAADSSDPHGVLVPRFFELSEDGGSHGDQEKAPSVLDFKFFPAVGHDRDISGKFVDLDHQLYLAWNRHLFSFDPPQWRVLSSRGQKDKATSPSPQSKLRSKPMKKQFFPQPQKTFKLAAPTRATKPTTPKTAPPLVDLNVIIKADEQNITHVWFDSLDGPSFATSTYKIVNQGEEFVCLFCQHKTYDRDPMVSHFMAHLEKNKEIVLLLGSNPSFLEAFRALQPTLAKAGDPLELIKKLLQKGALIVQKEQLPGRPDIKEIAEKVLATFPPKPALKK
jgi:hypothetical protein